MDFKTLTNLGRFKEIVVVLMKYGFHDVIDRMEIPGAKIIKKLHDMDDGLGTFERIRFACEELGPTFVKAGQILSLRPDLLPQPLLDELSKLQDNVAPESIAQIREVIEKTTGKSLEDTFSVFEVEPLAAASISQVHRALINDNDHIASVKVQRPDIRAKMETDLNILEIVANRLHERIDELKTYNLPDIVYMIGRTMIHELDFKREARNIKIARGYADEHSRVYIPEVYEKYCTEHLLVMEYVQGTQLKDMRNECFTDPHSLARDGLHAAIDQILKDGFFHADPHPGNVIITEDQRICLIDWGMTGRLSERDRYELIYLLKAVLEKDGEAMVYAFLSIAHSDESVDRRKLERDLLDMLDSHYAVPVKEMNIGRLLMAITEMLGEYQLRLPPAFVIMIKALVTAEGTVRWIYQDLDVFSEARDHISFLALERFKPDSLWKDFNITFTQWFRLRQEVPRRLEKILQKAENGDLTLGFRHENLMGIRDTLENVSNRLTFGVIIAAMIIGSSMIITTGIGPFLFGFPALGVVGYIISGVLGLWLIFNIIRGRKF